MSIDPVFDTAGTFGKTPVLFFVDHVRNEIPCEFHDLGVDHRFLATHIGYDVGALDLTLDVAQRFDARTVWCGFSRLLIDPNRSLDREDLIPEVSDGITIPGNQNLTATAREERIHRFFEPYHIELAEEIDASVREYAQHMIISIHSFTPRLHADKIDRPWEIGVLWNHDEPSARTFMQSISDRSSFSVGDNAPYDARGFNYTIDRHVKPLRLKHLTLEIRHDLIATPEGVERIAPLLEGAIGDVIATELV